MLRKNDTSDTFSFASKTSSATCKEAPSVVDFYVGRDEPANTRASEPTDQMLLRDAFRSSVMKRKEEVKAWYSDRCKTSPATKSSGVRKPDSSGDS